MRSYTYTTPGTSASKQRAHLRDCGWTWSARHRMWSPPRGGAVNRDYGTIPAEHYGLVPARHATPDLQHAYDQQDDYDEAVAAREARWRA